MPPKAKYTREEIVDIALQLVAEKGIDALNARNLGAALGTSTRPVFTAFKNMNELSEEVRAAAMRKFDSYAENSVMNPAFKNVGMQMIHFAAEQPKLFQLLYMNEHQETIPFDNLFTELGDTAGNCVHFIMRDYGLNEQEAMLLFRNLWLYTFGVCVLIASKVCRYDPEGVSDMLTSEFMAMMALIKSGKAFSLPKYTPGAELPM